MRLDEASLKKKASDFVQGGQLPVIHKSILSLARGCQTHNLQRLQMRELVQTTQKVKRPKDLFLNPALPTQTKSRLNIGTELVGREHEVQQGGNG